MTLTQTTRLVSRAIAVYLLFWAITDLISIPREILSLLHEIHLSAAVPRAELPDNLASTRSFYLRQAVLFLAENVLRISLWILAAGFFYRGTPFIQRLLGEDPVDKP